MVDNIIFWIASGAIAVLRVLPLGFCFALGQVLGACAWAILPGYRKLARQNLTIAFGREKSAAEISRLSFKHFTTLGANMVCAFRMATLPQKTIEAVCEMENREIIERAVHGGRGVLLAINHLSNWELYGQLPAYFNRVRFGTVYQALRNKKLDDLINADRRKRGVGAFDRKKGFNEALALLREPGTTAVLIDQNAGDGGMWTPFFNRLASTSPLAASLAMRTNAVMVPGAIITTGFARWKVVFEQPIPWSEAEPEKLTADLNVALEKQIRRSPHDWFWVHNRWKTPAPNFLTATQKRGTYLPPGAAEKLQPFRIVIRSPNWLGDAVMSLRAARAFKLGRPDARLTILTPEKLAPLWRSVPEVDEVLTFAPKESVFAVAKKLHGRFEVAVLFTNSLRSALEVWLAGIPRRVGYAGHRRAKLLNQIIPERKKKKAPKAEHHATRYWRIAERCGAVEPPTATHPPRSAPERLVIGICPGAEFGPAKRWPTSSFRRTMELVSAQIPCSWVIVGTAADQPLAQEILQGFAGSAEDLTGKTTLEELMNRLRTFQALLTNDTGTMHLADWLDVPLVAVFGSTEPALTGPRSPESHVLRHQVECSPCFMRECPIDFRCMRGVTPEEAAARLIAMLGREKVH